MLAGNRAAGTHAGLHDLATCLAHVHQIVAAAQIKTDQRMQIAVAGVKNVCELQVVFRADAISFGEHLGQARARHYGVLNHDVGRQPADGAERAFARRPKFLSFVLIGRAAD